MSDSNHVGAWISEAKFSYGSFLSFSRNEVVLFMGPNNSGKSVTLRDLSTLFGAAQSSVTAVQEVTLKTSGTDDEVIHWLTQYAFPLLNGKRGGQEFRHVGAAINSNNVKNSWDYAANNGLRELANFFRCYLGTNERLNAANPPPSVPLHTQAPQHPIHVLQKDDSIESRLSALFRMAFGEDLIVHRNAGSQVPLYCGQKPVILSGEDRVSASYIKRLEQLPTLQSQGDGMKSFVAVLLACSP